MPPKIRKPAERVEESEDRESVASGESTAATAGSEFSTAGSVTVEQLEKILAVTTASSQAASDRALAANVTAMTALIASLPSIAGSGAPIGAPPLAPRSERLDVPKWSELDTPSEYFTKFEMALTLNGVDKSKWGKVLPVYLTGTAQTAFTQISPETLTNYARVKEAMLIHLGDTPVTAERRWWSLSRMPGEKPGAFHLRVRSTANRRFDGMSRDEMFESVVLSRFLSLLPQECYTYVIGRRPVDGQEAARYVQEYEVDKPTPVKQHFQRSYYKREPGNGGASGSYKGHDGTNVSSEVKVGGSSSSSGSSGGSSSTTPQNTSSSNGQNGGSRGRQDRSSHRERKPIICFGCGVAGHIRPNCPDRNRRVRTPEGSNEMSINGWLAGSMVKGLLVDTVADRTVVRKEFIPEVAYTGATVILDSWRGGQFSEHKLANITIKLGSVEAVTEVAVDDSLDCPALLGSDLQKPLKREMIRLVAAQMEDEQPVVDMEEVVRVVAKEPIRATRAQVRKELEEEESDSLASEQADCDPVPLPEIADYPEAYFDEDCEATPVEAWSTLPEADLIEIALPRVAGTGSASLVAEQQADVTLKNVLEMAKKGENGYEFSQGVAVHCIKDELGDSVKRMVVPVGRRQQVLELGHSNLLAGHFGVKKTYARITRNFLWPGLSVQVKELIRGCPGCQKAARNSGAKAPLQPLPVVSEPFSKVAFDLVGPLPRTTSGYKYLLTFMCLYTKYPEAIPLKRVDNVTVLEAMMEIFSRHGFPREILTDQGSVFMSRMTQHMCKTFEVHKVKTSPYHPQSDGALERWHACLKGMFKRTETDLKNWDRQLKYMLFAYRDTPHCVTGYSPFTLMFGRDVRGPLDLLRSSWVEDEAEGCTISDWLVNVKARMCDMAELVSVREGKAKQAMKFYYDRTASCKSFKVGDQVLVRKPVLHGKLGDSWDGPYEVVKKVSPVTYSVQVPGKPTKAKTLHCNMLRKWTTPAARIHRVMVMEEEESECEASSGLKLVRQNFVPTKAEQQQLDGVLSDFSDVLCPKPGLTKLVQLNIKTGEHGPIMNHPNGVPPRWKDPVELQIKQLQDLGIIRPSDSPWSSSMVTVRKKDGGVRICIDYRAVNNITQPDPYLMPMIDEILNALSSAKFISKVDLNKGFHQIPVKQEDIPKTAFCTPWGKFEFVVMPFGLRNGPAVFQRLMDSVLHQDKDISQVYIDDIAIFSESWGEHCDHVLLRLRKAGLTVNVGKCKWGQTSCEFLGHVVGNGMVSPADLKVQAVREFPVPKTKKQVRQFLGLTGYYRRFVQNYAEHTFTLTEATKKSSSDRIVCSNELLCEVNYLKDVLCCLPSLTLAGPKDQFLLQTDASGVGLGAVLSVVRKDQELPVAFFSRKLQPRERRYSATELEGLAIVAAVTHFDTYLITHPFVIETDHRALTFINTADHCNGRIARWAMKLQPYTYTIRYRAGPQNGNADALSRCWELEGDASRSSRLSEGGGDVMRQSPLQEPAS